MSLLKIAVIGGGASGFFGAITAAETFANAEVTIYEKSPKLLNKVRVSGGGRCNVTHACFDNRQLSKHYPRGERWLRPLLTHFDATATVRWFETKGVPLKTEPDGRMFPLSNSSETIIDCLLSTANRLGIRIRTSCGITALTPAGDAWTLTTSNDETIQADRVLVATGGYPQLPSYGWLPDQTEPTVVPVPSLFTFNVPGITAADSAFFGLAGVSVPDAKVQIVGTKLEQRGPLLFTHWGFSGPAVLKLSAWAARELANVSYAFTLRIHWVPALNEAQVRDEMQAFRLQNAKKQVSSLPIFGLPARLWKALLQETGISETQRWADLPAKNQNRLIEKLTNSQFQVTGKSTFKDEFVTCGGIALGSLNPRTLESGQHKGLFFAGEVLDVDGITGGFNFQNAWTTGYLAGKHIGI